MLLKLEDKFEKFSEFALRIFGNSPTFLIALAAVLFWFATIDAENTTLHDLIRDIFISITFLTFFILQKSFNKLNTALHIKLNELVAAHENARNDMVNIEEKSEEKLRELQEHYANISKNDNNRDH